MSAGAPESANLAVVGGGIIGLAVARECSPGALRQDCVLEREPKIARHQTAHSSGVIHAGVYYAPGSLKARLCVEGARELYEYCERHKVASERCGKLILATDASELGRLAELERRGLANGVRNLRRVEAGEIGGDRAPRARGRRPLLPPDGDRRLPRYGAGVRREIADGGATIATGCEVQGVSPSRQATAPDPCPWGHRGRTRHLLRRGLGRPARRGRRSRAPIRGSSPSGAPTFACFPGAATWSEP